MRVAVQSGLLRLFPLDLALQKIQQAGYDGVELWGGQPHGYILDLVREIDGELVVDEALAAAIRDQCARHGRALACYTPEQVLYPINMLVQEASPLDGARMRQQSRRLLDLSIDAAAALGCGRVVVASPMWPWHETPDGYAPVGKDEAINAVIGEVERLVRRAEERSVTVLFEAQVAEFSNAIETLEETTRLLERIPSPHLQVLLDTGHVAVSACRLGLDPVDYFEAHLRAFGSRVGYIHVDDNAGDADAHLAPGAGTLDLPGMLRVLDAAGYDGWVSVELGILGEYVLPRTAERLLREARQYLAQALSAGIDRPPSMGTERPAR